MPCIHVRLPGILPGGDDMKTKTAKQRLGAHLGVVLARLQGEAEVPKAEAAASGFLGVAQGVELRELAHLTASRLAERAKRLHIALTRVADGEYGVCSECGTSISPKRLLAIPDATTCVACQERLEHARSRPPRAGRRVGTTNPTKSRSPAPPRRPSPQ